MSSLQSSRLKRTTGTAVEATRASRPATQAVMGLVERSRRRVTVPVVSVHPFRSIYSVHPFRGFPYTWRMGVGVALA